MSRPCAVIYTLAAMLVLHGLAIGQAQQGEGSAASQDFVIRTTSRLVLLDVSVKDARGDLVTGLTQQSFQVYEDGKPQTITQFANADIPVTVGIVVDQSGSMLPKRPDVVVAALAFIAASNPNDEVFVTNFNDKVRFGLPPDLPFSDNVPLLRSALWAGEPGGRTALYDGIADSLVRLELGRRDKKTLVVVSDGGDNASRESLAGLTRKVLESRATIYTIGVFSADDPDKNPGVLMKLARMTGGEAYFPEQLNDVVPICQKIAKDIRTRYTIGYIPAAGGRPRRNVRVIATAPQLGKLTVRTRTSYLFSPDHAAAAEGR